MIRNNTTPISYSLDRNTPTFSNNKNENVRFCQKVNLVEKNSNKQKNKLYNQLSDIYNQKDSVAEEYEFLYGKSKSANCSFQLRLK